MFTAPERRWPLLLILILLPVGLRAREEAPLTVAAVQMFIDEDTCRTEEAFWRAVETPLAEAARQGAALVVYPEYLGVFYSLIPYTGLIQESSGISEALSVLSRRQGKPVQPRDLFLSGEQRVGQALARWSSLAGRYGVTLVAGSFFVPHDSGTGVPELRNRTFVISPEEGVIYSQDKVYLTDFERQILGLSPGTPESGGFGLRDRRIVITICRDTFFPEWEELFRDRADLWIDIKANGTAFDGEQEDIFRRALPARLPGAGIPRGLTVCLTGRYLDLLWEGRSSLIINEGGAVRTAAEARWFDRGEILYFTLP